jgi:hypothetical protein
MGAEIVGRAKRSVPAIRVCGGHVTEPVIGPRFARTRWLLCPPCGAVHAVSTVGQSTSSSGTIHVSFSAAARHSAQAGSPIMVSM